MIYILLTTSIAINILLVIKLIATNKFNDDTRSENDNLRYQLKKIRESIIMEKVDEKASVFRKDKKELPGYQVDEDF